MKQPHNPTHNPTHNLMRAIACVLLLATAASAQAKPFGEYYVDCAMTYPRQERDSAATRSICEAQAEKLKAAEPAVSTPPSENPYDTLVAQMPADNSPRPGQILGKIAAGIFLAMVGAALYGTWRLATLAWARMSKRPA